MGCFNYYCVLFCWFVRVFLLPKFHTSGVHRLMSSGRKESSWFSLILLVSLTDSCHRGCRWAAAPAVVINNPSMSLLNICRFIKSFNFFNGSGALVQRSGHWVVNGGWTGEPPSPQGLAWNISVEAEYFQIVSQALMFYVAVNVEGWPSQMAVAEQVSWKPPLKRGKEWRNGCSISGTPCTSSHSCSLLFWMYVASTRN